MSEIYRCDHCGCELENENDIYMVDGDMYCEDCYNEHTISCDCCGETPGFLDKLIGLYERKNTTQKDRMYILLELKKYYNPKIINFFFKLNDTESINEALHVIHENGLIHKKIKPSNIMLCDNDKDIVLTDFEIENTYHSNDESSCDYSSIETFRGQFYEESDYYSFGITLYELFCGRTPYSNMKSDEKEKYLSEHTLPLQSNMPVELCNLIHGLTYFDIDYIKKQNNPNRRWSFDEVDNWCKGKNQLVPGKQDEMSDEKIPAYTFMRKKYKDISMLVDSMALNLENGKKQIFMGVMSED